MIRPSTTNPKDAGKSNYYDHMPADYRMLQDSALYFLFPKDHGRVRRAVGPALTPRAVERLRPEVQRIIDDALAPWEGRDEIDIAVLVEYVPIRVIATMLGIPREHEDTFLALAQASVKTLKPWLSADELGEVFAPMWAGIELLRSFIAERRKNPLTGIPILSMYGAG